MTKSKLKTRFNQHKCAASSGKKSPLYDCMRKYQDFLIVLKQEGLSYEEACKKEIQLIQEAKEAGHFILNLAKGGEGGFVVSDILSWKERLKEKRKNRKPALGMLHTEENKKIFSLASKAYWETQKTFSAKEVCSLPFKEANKLLGISKTHYYRLKRSLSNDQ